MSKSVRQVLRSDAAGSQSWAAAAWLASGTEIFEVAAGRCLLIEGDPSSDVYLLMDGTAAATDSTGQVRVLCAGSLAGAIEPVLSVPRLATVECVTACVLARIDGGRFSQAWHICARLRSAAQWPTSELAHLPLRPQPEALHRRVMSGCQRTAAALRNQSTTATTNVLSRLLRASNR